MEEGQFDKNINASATDSLRDFHSVSHDDATWILTSAFIIFTMQSGKFFFCFCWHTPDEKEIKGKG